MDLSHPGIYGCVFADSKLWIQRLFERHHDLCWRKSRSISDIVEEIHFHRADPSVDIDYIGQRLNGPSPYIGRAGPPRRFRSLQLRAGLLMSKLYEIFFEHCPNFLTSPSRICGGGPRQRHEHDFGN